MTSHSQVAATPEDVRSLRTRMGLNQQAFGNLFEVNQATVSRWEHGLIPIDHGVQELLRRAEASSKHEQPKLDTLAGLDLDGHWPWLLRFFRTFRKLSQEEFAELVGRSVETISRWERGHFAPDLRAQIVMRDLILAPLDSDSVFRDVKARLEASPGMYNANWGRLIVAASSGLLRHCEKRGYSSPLHARVDQLHHGLYADWIRKRTEAGFFKGEVLLSYGHIRVGGDDTRILITVPMTLDTGAVLGIVTNLPAAFPPELEGQINTITADTAIG